MKFLKGERNKYGLSRYELSELTGIGYRRLMYIENNNEQFLDTRYSELEAIANAFDVTVDHLVSEYRREMEMIS